MTKESRSILPDKRYQCIYRQIIIECISDLLFKWTSILHKLIVFYFLQTFFIGRIILILNPKDSPHHIF